MSFNEDKLASLNSDDYAVLPLSTIANVPGLNNISFPVSKNGRSVETLAVDTITTNGNLSNLFTNGQYLQFNFSESACDKIIDQYLVITITNNGSTGMVLAPTFQLFSQIQVWSSNGMIEICYPENYFYEYIAMQTASDLALLGQMMGFNYNTMAGNVTIPAAGNQTFVMPLYNVITRCNLPLRHIEGMYLRFYFNNSSTIFAAGSPDTTLADAVVTNANVLNIGEKMGGDTKKTFEDILNSNTQVWTSTIDQNYSVSVGVLANNGAMSKNLQSSEGVWTRLIAYLRNTTLTTAETQLGVTGSTSFSTHVLDNVTLYNQNLNPQLGTNVARYVIQDALPYSLGFDSPIMTITNALQFCFSGRRSPLFGEGAASAGGALLSNIWKLTGTATAGGGSVDQTLIILGQRMIKLYRSPTGKLTWKIL